MRSGATPEHSSLVDELAERSLRNEASLGRIVESIVQFKLGKDLGQFYVTPYNATSIYQLVRMLPDQVLRQLMVNHEDEHRMVSRLSQRVAKQLYDSDAPEAVVRSIVKALYKSKKKKKKQSSRSCSRGRSRSRSVNSPSPQPEKRRSRSCSQSRLLSENSPAPQSKKRNLEGQLQKKQRKKRNLDDDQLQKHQPRSRSRRTSGSTRVQVEDEQCSSQTTSRGSESNQQQPEVDENESLSFDEFFALETPAPGSRKSSTSNSPKLQQEEQQQVGLDDEQEQQQLVGLLLANDPEAWDGFQSEVRECLQKTPGRRLSAMKLLKVLKEYFELDSESSKLKLLKQARGPGMQCLVQHVTSGSWEVLDKPLAQYPIYSELEFDCRGRVEGGDGVFTIDVAEIKQTLCRKAIEQLVIRALCLKTVLDGADLKNLTVYLVGRVAVPKHVKVTEISPLHRARAQALGLQLFLHKV